MNESRSQAAARPQQNNPGHGVHQPVPTRLIRPFAVTALIALFLVGVWIYLQTRNTTPSLAPTTAAIGNGVGLKVDFDLVDHRGRNIALQGFRGAPLLVAFGYTYCPDVCPITLSRIATVLDDLVSDDIKARAVFITVDPARDTPEVLASYVEAFHPRLTGLTGDASSLKAAAATFRVYYQKVGSDEDGYLMDHSAYIYLLGPDGDVLSYYRPDLDAETLAGEVRSRLQDLF